MQSASNSSSSFPQGTMSNMGMGSSQQRIGAGPPSGKYAGFGSEDINRLGYNKEGQFAQPYDPYTKAQSAPT